MSLWEKYQEDPQFAKLMAQEELIMEVTETLCEILDKEGLTRKELATRLGKSKGFVSQLLNGGRNLTLRTVGDILHVLGYTVTLQVQKVESRKVTERSLIGFEEEVPLGGGRHVGHDRPTPKGIQIVNIHSGSQENKPIKKPA